MCVPSERRVGVSDMSRSPASAGGAAVSAVLAPAGAAFHGTSPRALT